MALRKLQIRGYRSLREFSLPLGPVNVITGANGTGKSNLYQALVLVSRAANGQLARALAEEGGLPSVFWAGGERIRYTRKPPLKRIDLAVETESFTFQFAIGIRPSGDFKTGESLFKLDPDVKEEKLWLNGADKPVLMLDRRGPSTWVRNPEGKMDEFPIALLNSESVLPQIVEPHRYPEISLLRQTLSGWRFYHQFRTDAQSPLRSPQIGVQTNVLSSDGSDLAAVLETILEIGDEAGLNETIARAFNGARLQVVSNEILFSVLLEAPGLLRPLGARELSDGQLRFLCLCAALLSPRPPSLLALNEPETSLHPDLFEPLARLIARAARNSQIWVTTHSRALADRIAEHANVTPIELALVEGETRRAGDRNSPRRPHKLLRFEEADTQNA